MGIFNKLLELLGTVQRFGREDRVTRRIVAMTSLQVWATILGLLVLLAGSVAGLSKSNRSRTDAVVLNYMEMHARKHSGNRLQSLADITQTLGMSEKRVTEALTRLRTAGKVRAHGENWGLI